VPDGGSPFRFDKMACGKRIIGVPSCISSSSAGTRKRVSGLGTVVGTCARVTVDQFRHLALQTCYGHSGSMNILTNQMFKYV
jgi:hypothetical protein